MKNATKENPEKANNKTHTYIYTKIYNKEIHTQHT